MQNYLKQRENVLNSSPKIVITFEIGEGYIIAVKKKITVHAFLLKIEIK
jgi:hypothetical protein